MMAARQLTPELEALELRRDELLGKMRWLSPNAQRRRELKAEHTRLTRLVLELEVKAAETPKPSPSPFQPQDEEDDPRSPVPRLWWADQ